jgi:hypothetical protein
MIGMRYKMNLTSVTNGLILSDKHAISNYKFTIPLVIQAENAGCQSPFLLPNRKATGVMVKLNHPEVDSIA